MNGDHLRRADAFGGGGAPSFGANFTLPNMAGLAPGTRLVATRTTTQVTQSGYGGGGGFGGGSGTDGAMAQLNSLRSLALAGAAETTRLSTAKSEAAEALARCVTERDALKGALEDSKRQARGSARAREGARTRAVRLRPSRRATTAALR